MNVNNIGLIIVSILILAAGASIIHIYFSDDSVMTIIPTEGLVPLTVTVSTHRMADVTGHTTIYFGDGSSTLFCWGYCWDHSVTHTYVDPPGRYQVTLIQSYYDEQGWHQSQLASRTIVVY